VEFKIWDKEMDEYIAQRKWLKQSVVNTVYCSTISKTQETS